MKHIGNEADSIIRKKKLKKKDIADKMGITDVYLSQIFKKESIDAGLLEKLSQAIRVPVSYWFENDGVVNQSIVNGNGSAASVYGDATAGVLADKDKEIEHLRQLIEEKERTIQILMNRR
jgi:transcriptional regulator with XRE-family HTH domain